jgi:hypothetical protein
VLTLPAPPRPAQGAISALVPSSGNHRRCQVMSEEGSGKVGTKGGRWHIHEELFAGLCMSILSCPRVCGLCGQNFVFVLEPKTADVLGAREVR